MSMAVNLYAFLYISNFKSVFFIKFVFSKKATKIDKIFAVDLTLTT